MENRSIGQLTVSLVGLGCNSFGRFVDEDRAVRTVRAAFDAGITLFDTANVYVGIDGASEMHVAKGLGSRRDEVVVATKFGKDPFGDRGRIGGSPTAVRRAIEGSLRRLRTDRLDLYQIHEPDPAVPIEETLGVLDDLVREGKVREIGHSCFSAEQIDEAGLQARRIGATPFVSAQVEWSLLSRQVEREVIPATQRNGVSILPFWPLSSGLLTGKYTPGGEVDPSWRLAMVPNRTHFLTQQRFEILASLRRFAHEAGHTVLDLAMSWLAARPEIGSVIAGATSPDQIRANLKAAFSWRLSEDELHRIDEITAPVC